MTLSKKNEVPPVIPSGFAKRRSDILFYIVGLTIVYAAIFFQFLTAESIPGFPKPAKEYCSEDDATVGPCSRSDLFGFQISSGLAIWCSGLLGFYVWHISKRVHTALPFTPEGRLYGYLPESETIAAVNFSFQCWDFFISLLIPEHRGPRMLVHHVSAAILCYLSLEYQVCNSCVIVHNLWCEWLVWFVGHSMESHHCLFFLHVL